MASIVGLVQSLKHLDLPIRSCWCGGSAIVVGRGDGGGEDKGWEDVVVKVISSSCGYAPLERVIVVLLSRPYFARWCCH